MIGSVLVIGGGIGGIQTSLDLTELGFKVYLVEKEPSIGGRMAQFDRLFPGNDCSLCVLAPKMVSVYRNPNIELYTLSTVKEVNGNAGDFTVTIEKKPRYVDEEKCRGCGDCAAKCPKVEAPNIFDMNLGKRKSSYIPFPQATPPTYLIDPDLCLYLNRNVCGVCKKVCQASAINFEQQEELITLKVGAIVVSTGFDMLGEELSSMWGYQYDNVVNALEYERMLSSSGPFGGNILRPSDEEEPKRIAFIQCLGSIGPENNDSYCSQVCCMYTAKQAINSKKNYKDSQIVVFRHNIRVFGKNFYEYTKNARDEYNIKYLYSKISEVSEDPDTNDLSIHYEDLKRNKETEFKANLVVLAAPLIPSKGTKELAQILGIELDDYSFFKERSYYNNSLSSRDGIFLCGLCQGPMNITDTVSNASGVAGQIAIMLNSEKFSLIKERESDVLPQEDIININPSALVIGGGVSGITAALNISKQGFKTYIVEKEKVLGGNLNNINILYPTQTKASKLLYKLVEDVKRSENIEVFRSSNLKNIEGTIGNYTIGISDVNDDIHTVNTGVIILATGCQEYKPKGAFQYDNKNKNVVTLLDLEKKFRNEDKSWLDGIDHVTTIMCVQARQKFGYSYCSNVCCLNTIKNIKVLKEIKPELEILVLFRDLHTAKMEFEEIFNERNKIAKYLRYNLSNLPEVSQISKKPEKYHIEMSDDFDVNRKIDFETDLIVLATPMIPSNNLKELAAMLDVPLDENGFFPEAHEKLRPLDFVSHGIFVCGCAQWPKSIQDSINQANGAAGRASRFLSRRKITSTNLELMSFLLSIECYFKDLIVNPEKCNGCGTCAENCAFKAIDIVDAERKFEDVSIPVKKAVINSALCKGCGKCAASCKLKAIKAKHYDFKQISSIIDPYFLDEVKPEKVLGEKVPSVTN
ncbi:MAG: FAD-dependent oxidoreductase [Promethearchaeota archaeon]|jgi:heterodisulfide reductase subunit A